MGMSDENILIERLAIEDVFARYAHTADGYDAEGWVECYTEDGIFEVETDGNRIQFVGSSGITGFYPCAHPFAPWYPACHDQPPCEYRGRQCYA